MKKEAKVEYGIQIVKPWSKAMYDHNEEVAEVVHELVSEMWSAAVTEFVNEFDEAADFYSDCLDWEHNATEQMLAIQTAITCYGFGFGYNIASVSERIMQDLDETPLYRLKEIAEDLGLELEKGFIGFN